MPRLNRNVRLQKKRTGQISTDDLLERIYQWYGANYPEGPMWNEKGFHCFRDVPPPVKYIVAFDVVAGEIANGGWGQLLWNVYPNWRELLQVAQEGYSYFGDEQRATVVSKLNTVFAQNEADCLEYMRKCVDDVSFNKNFAEFTFRGYGSEPMYGENLLFDSDPKKAWFESKRREIELVIGT